ncbi:hypothetical protein ACH9EU_18110 [Kocuria sp. M1R5S2]|uniref:hypothetical protein n=1 Tax=Kocuria rhizosphaerae TaxID=3376285 RepID=UPI0037B1F9CA
MNIVSLARQAKHALHVRRKHLKWRLRPVKIKAYDRWRANNPDRKPYVYHEDQYPHTFLRRPTPATRPAQSVPRRIFVIWVGNTPMNPRRAESLESIRQAQTDVEVVLIDEISWTDWIVTEGPIHHAFGLLSPVHRSDYMRAYLMHFHGGGYCDIKPLSSDWGRLFDTLNDHPDVWAIGYREVTSEYTPDLPHALGADVKRHYKSVFGPSAFIFRPCTPFTEEWWRELSSRMDYYASALRESPGGDPYNPPGSYPIRWTEILGDITQPLCLKHQQHIRFDDTVRPRLKDYRA